METAKQLASGTADLYTAEVKHHLDGKFLLADRYGRVTKAQRAVSCLIAPEVGDRVLAVSADDDASYLLAVLERNGRTSSTLEMAGDVKLSLPTGRLDVTARDGLSLGTPGDLSLIADTLGLTGGALMAAFEKLNLFSDTAEAHLTDVKLFSKRLRGRVESAVQQFVTRHVKVDGVDSVTAGTIKQTAKELMNLRSVFTFMKARKNVKIDGKQIFMG